jgi:hypothetical protein
MFDQKNWIHILWWVFLPNFLVAQTMIDLGRFEEDLRISNFLPSSGLGTSLAAGDVNGDGVEDLLSGALATGLFYEAGGGAFLIPGRVTLPRFIDLANVNGRVAFWGNGPQAYTGFLVDLFDFSGDGLADIFISAPQYLVTRENQGRGKIYYLPGRKSWSSELTLQDNPADGAATLYGEHAGAFLGTGSTHGDFNGDGIGDLAVVSRFAARPSPLSQQATAYIIWGGQRLVNGPIDNSAFSRCVIIPPSENQAAMTVFAGNLDGDACQDLIVTLPQAQQFEPTESGIAGCILWGRPEWPAVIDLTNIQKAINVTFLISRRAGVYIGTLFATGDFDGSGATDVAVNIKQSSLQLKSVHVYRDPFKQRPLLFDWFDPAHRRLVVRDRYLNERSFPYNLASLDWNADGFDDLVISSQAFRDIKRISEGMAYVLYGSATLLDSVDFRNKNAKWDLIWGGSENASIEQAVIKADVNTDGKDDLVFGGWTATTTKGGVASGEVYVLLNRATDANKPVPARSALLPVSPNPFRNVSVIWFELAQTENVTLEIFDLLGRRVRLLRDGNLSAGTYSALWNGTDESGNLSSAGVYFAILRTSTQVQKQKLLLIR